MGGLQMKSNPNPDKRERIAPPRAHTTGISFLSAST
jgi:hypothetical protein